RPGREVLLDVLGLNLDRGVKIGHVRVVAHVSIRSSNVRPAASSTVLMFSKTCRIWAAGSPSPTRLHCASTGIWPANVTSPPARSQAAVSARLCRRSHGRTECPCYPGAVARRGEASGNGTVVMPDDTARVEQLEAELQRSRLQIDVVANVATFEHAVRVGETV